MHPQDERIYIIASRVTWKNAKKWEQTDEFVKYRKIQNEILVYSIQPFTINYTQAYNSKNVPNNLIANVAGIPQGTIRNCKDNNR